MTEWPLHGTALCFTFGTVVRYCSYNRQFSSGQFNSGFSLSKQINIFTCLPLKKNHLYSMTHLCYEAIHARLCSIMLSFYLVKYPCCHYKNTRIYKNNQVQNYSYLHKPNTKKHHKQKYSQHERKFLKRPRKYKQKILA